MTNLAEKYDIDTSHAHNEACPRCRRNGRDRSGDNLAVYGPGLGCYCWACKFTVLSDEQRAERGLDDYQEEEEVSTKEPVTTEEQARIKSYTSTKSKGWRGIRDETNVAYGVRYSYDEETGLPDKMFVPTTIDDKLVGYKTRVMPKDFTNPIGVTGKNCQMIGQHRYKNGGRTVVIVGGEVDMLSAEQMLWDYQVSKNNQDWPRVAVVSPSIGESGAAKQVQAQYEWFNSFEKIIIGLDNDEAGKEATKSLVAVLPKGKTFVAEWSKKDPNALLTAGPAGAKAFINDYFRAKPYTPDGIVGSGGLLDKIREQALIPKIPLPPFMHRVQAQMAGGIPLGVIVNLASASGTGKSTIIDECTYFWVFSSPHRIGVITMESDSGQYGTKILSRHMGRKIDLIEDVEEKLAFLDADATIEAAHDLFKLPDGSDRWHLIEDRDGGLESLKELIMQLIVQCECKVIIIDPVQDMLEGLTNEEQAKFCGWMKGVIKSHGITFVNVSHVRKSGAGQKANSTGAEMHEEDIFGSGSLIKSAACNLLFSRDKEAEDEIEKNTTYMKMSKCRWTGKTGVAGEYYYHGATHTLYDKADWLASQGGGFSNG